jgi:hypothetical protein
MQDRLIEAGLIWVDLGLINDRLNSQPKFGLVPADGCAPMCYAPQG